MEYLLLWDDTRNWTEACKSYKSQTGKFQGASDWSMQAITQWVESMNHALGGKAKAAATWKMKKWALSPKDWDILAKLCNVLDVSSQFFFRYMTNLTCNFLAIPSGNSEHLKGQWAHHLQGPGHIQEHWTASRGSNCGSSTQRRRLSKSQKCIQSRPCENQDSHAESTCQRLPTVGCW